MTHAKRLTLPFCLLVLFVTLFAGSFPTQARSSLSGRWIWKEVARKNKPQTQFSIFIRREGNVVRGTYSVDEFINGEWQGEDGNQTAFIGRVKGNTITIEFDPEATVPGYQQNVSYQAPTDGRKPSVATLTLTGQTLVWRFVSGAPIAEVPAKLSLHRDRVKK